MSMTEAECIALAKVWGPQSRW